MYAFLYAFVVKFELRGWHQYTNDNTANTGVAGILKVIVRTRPF